MTRTVIAGGRVVSSSEERRLDFAVDAGSGAIVVVGEDLTGDLLPEDQVLDASGCVVTPGFVDLHADLGQPGHEAAETIESGSRAAALGGFTAVVAMPNTTPSMDSPAVITEVMQLASSVLCEVKPSASITVGCDGEQLAPLGELVDLGVRMFTDGDTGVQDAGVMRKALVYASSLASRCSEELVFSQHCEVSALSQGGVMHEGEWSSRLGLIGQPVEAEELMVARDIALSRLTGMRVHMQHLSTAGSVELVRQAKAQGVAVSAEATPHHFTLTDASCKDFTTVFKVRPPLRTAADVAAIKVGLADGTIDAIATDHVPHTADLKEQPFDTAPFGVIGLETAFALANTELDLSFSELVRLLSVAPAKIAGLQDRHGQDLVVGAAANIAVFDTEKSWKVHGSAMASKSSNTPFEGMTLTGKVRHTIFNGEVVVKDEVATR